MKSSGFRWWVISLIALATVINYIDRNALAVMWPEVSKDIGATRRIMRCSSPCSWWPTPPASRCSARYST